MRLLLRFASLFVLLLPPALFAQDPPPVPAAATPAPAPAAPAATPYAAPAGRYHHHYQDKFENLKIDPKHPIDVLPHRRDGATRDQSTLTLNDLSPLTINDFQPEPRDVFHLMDQVMTPVLDDNGQPVLGPDGQPKTSLQPLHFKQDADYSPANRDQRAIFGRNTWLLWCGGNEDFWDWLAQNGYGVLDFLKAIDSRKRGSRLADLGLINQPGLRGSAKAGPWGLYLDTVEPATGKGAAPGDLRLIGEEGDFHLPYRAPEYDSYARQYADPQGRTLQSDGVNPLVYGYPSGVIGLRLFPNPKFFETVTDDHGAGADGRKFTTEAHEAQKRWNADAFYNDYAYATDPRTVRPYLVGMSCAICHVSIHPLNPPAHAEEPEWSNLSSIIGAQYFRTSAAFGTRLERTNFLWHYVASQQPGTIDTSMTATDQINNANAMNAVYELPARLARAKLNPPEVQSDIARTTTTEDLKELPVARVLMDGADSIGLRAALMRVYLNIGLYHNEWNLCSNTVIGFAPQKPFSIDLCRRNSLFWRVNENFRTDYLAEFFLWDKKSPTEFRTSASEPRYQCSTQAMHLKDVLAPAALIPASSKLTAPVKLVDLPYASLEPDQAAEAFKTRHEQEQRGGAVFTRHCMICHSSKQPEGFRIDFAHEPPEKAGKWEAAPGDGVHLTLPYAEKDWESFKDSPSYRAYREKAELMTGKGSDEAMLTAFLKDNYLSTDLRIPVSLTGTNAARAVATNSLQGQVWGEFSSETYRSLPAVGQLTYTDPITRRDATWEPPGHGPGYLRVPSLVSIWAAAPLLHNNSLGTYIPDEQEDLRVSVPGRLQMFDNAIEKLLWKSKRGLTPSGERGLRGTTPETWHGEDPGWIFRTDVETDFRIPAGHLRHLIIGVLPGVAPGWMGGLALKALDFPRLVPFVLLVISGLLCFLWPRGFFYLLVLSGVLLLAVLAITGVHYLVPGVVWLPPLALLVGGLAWVVTRLPREAAPARTVAVTSAPQRVAVLIARWLGVVTYVLVLIGLLVGLWVGREFVNGNLGELRLGPIPKGVPVSALMNLDPASSLFRRLGALRGMCEMLGELQTQNARERNSDERRRRFIVAHPAAPESQWPPLYRFSSEERIKVFERTAGPALLKASKCPDFVMDRGHSFGETLTDKDKRDLIAFLKTL